MQVNKAFNKHYDLIIRYSKQEDREILCSLNKDFAAYFRYVSKYQVEFRKLREHKVDYTDPGNLIYKDEKFSDYFKNNQYDIPKIYDLFLMYYNMEEINCPGKGITSIPILPNLRKLNCFDNELVSLPRLENLEELDCLYNQFDLFPGYQNFNSSFPKLKLFNGREDYPILLENFKKLRHTYSSNCYQDLEDYQY